MTERPQPCLPQAATWTGKEAIAPSAKMNNPVVSW